LLHVCALFSTSWTPAAGPKPLRWPALSRAHRFAGAVVDPQMAFSLPSFSRGSSEPEGPSEEAQGLYRMLGLAEDATYDEINEAYEVLATKYAGETKRLINLQVAKDKILEDRLRQRMSGSLKASVSESPFERRDEPRKLISLPPFLEGVMELPTRQELTKNAIVFACIGLLPVLSLSWASTSVSLGFAASLYLLYNRGVPDSGNTMGAEMRPPKVRPLLISAGVTFLAGAIGATLSQIVFGSLRLLPQQLVISLCTSFCFGMAATLFKAQDDY